MIGFLKGAGPGYCGFVNVTAGSRADLFHGPCCRPLVPPHRQTPRQQPPSRHLAGALAGQFFDALLPLWRCLADPSIRTRLVPADSAGDAGGAEVHAGLRLEGWFYDAIGFESTVSCNVEAMAQAVWAVVTSRAAGQERDGREGADLLMGFSSPAGGGAPTLKALLVPRVLEFNSRRKKMLPRCGPPSCSRGASRGACRRPSIACASQLVKLSSGDALALLGGSAQHRLHWPRLRTDTPPRLACICHLCCAATRGRPSLTPQGQRLWRVRRVGVVGYVVQKHLRGDVWGACGSGRNR